MPLADDEITLTFSCGGCQLTAFQKTAEGDWKLDANEKPIRTMDPGMSDDVELEWVSEFWCFRCDSFWLSVNFGKALAHSSRLEFAI